MFVFMFLGLICETSSYGASLYGASLYGASLYGASLVLILILGGIIMSYLLAGPRHEDTSSYETSSYETSSYETSSFSTRRLLVVCFVVGVWLGVARGLPEYVVEDNFVEDNFEDCRPPIVDVVDSQVLVIEDSVPVDVERVLFIRSYSHLLDGEVLGVIIDESRKYGIDPRLIMAQIEVESTFNPRAVSKVGARGLMQIMPATGRQLARELGFTDYDLFDPVTNVKMGIYYMSKLIKRFGDYDVALSAYFWGQTRVARDVSSYRNTEYSRKVVNASVNYR